MFTLMSSFSIARMEQYFSCESRMALSTASFLMFGPTSVGLQLDSFIVPRVFIAPGSLHLNLQPFDLLPLAIHDPLNIYRRASCQCDQVLIYVALSASSSD